MSKVYNVCDDCTVDLVAVGYAVINLPAVLPTIGKCDVCKKRRAVYKSAIGKMGVDEPCGEMVQSPAVTVLQHGNTR